MSRFARQWPWGALLASAALLAAVHAFETFGHMSPCELCLKQRVGYWIAVSVAVAGLVSRRFVGSRDLTPWINLALAIVFAGEMGLAAYHAGVEWKFWPGPAACTGGATHVDPAELERLLSGAKMTVPRCDQPAWIFLGLSMAGWNALVAFGLTAASAFAFLRGRRPA
ncbi:MAG: disulfide bond formation protein B [Caulobacteraceae bacterium]